MTLHRLALAGALLFACVFPASAQNSRVVSGCALSATLPLRDAAGLMVDENGKLCTNANGGSTTVTQGPAATDTSANRWPVLAYQGGAWTFGLSGPIPAGSNVIGAVTQSGGPWTVQGITGGVPIGVAQQDGTIPSGSPFSASSAATLFSIDTTGYSTISVQLSGTFNATIVYEGSNDASNWNSIVGYGPSNPGVGGPSGFDNSATIRSIPITTRYFRARISAYTSGTVVAVPVLRAGSLAPIGVYVGGITSGSNVIGSTTLRSAGTNRSATVGTAAVALMAANPARQGWKIKNDSAGDLWINFDATATATPGSGNIKIPAGGYLASEPGFVETGTLSIIGSAAGLAITVREY